MIKNKKEMSAKREIDLTGPDGNAFVLIGIAKDLARKLSKDGDAIIREMRKSNYDHLIEVFDREFGDFITLYR